MLGNLTTNLSAGESLAGSNKIPANLDSANCAQMLCHLLDQTNDNGAAILNLIERYVNHFAKRYCNLGFHEQQDIQQDVAVKLLCHGETVRHNCSKSWVYTVVRNQCINYIHKKTKNLSVFKFSENPEATANATGPPPSLNQSINIDLIQRIDCLQKVFDQVESQETGKADIAIYTQYAFGLSYQEISKRSRRTVAAIGNRISILKRRLKKLIKECC